jgi:tetratricopeptide (TPR) repeat protein
MYKAAIGEKNQEYYLENFARFDEKGSGFQASWNWGAFLGIAVWALYRKMYGLFFVWLAIQAIIVIAMKIHPSFGLLAIVPWLSFAVFANSLYHRKVKVQIINAQKSNLNEGAVIQRLKNDGGVLIVILYAVSASWIFLGLIFAVFAYKNNAPIDAATGKAEIHATKETDIKIEPPAALPNLIEKYEQALRINPEDTGAWHYLGNAYKDAKLYPEAIKSYQQALRINPEYADAWYSLANAYSNTKQYPLATEAYQQTLRINPNNTGAWIFMGINYEDLKLYPEAINALQQAVRIEPKAADAWIILGGIYHSAGNHAKVIEVYKQLKALKSESAEEFFKLFILPRGLDKPT